MADHLERRLRHPVELEATVAVNAGDCRSTRVTDLSLDGCCISGFYRIGSMVELKVRPLGTFQAQVRWAFGGRAGLRFTRQIQAEIANKSIAVDQRGVAAVEYCITACLIAISVIVAITGLGQNVKSNFNNVDKAVGLGMDYRSG